MADKPIMFTGPMIRALLEGRKTQTRRVLEPQPKVLKNGIWYRPYPVLRPLHWNYLHGDRIAGFADVRFATGDRLWVKEAWRFESGDNELTPKQIIDIFADPEMADPDERPLVCYEADQMMNQPLPSHGFVPGRYRHGRFMPRALSRLSLTVTDVRVQRLQDISDADAEAEGVEFESADPPFYYVPGILPHSLTAVGVEEPGGKHAQRSYAKLWDSINGKKHPWESNPWVAAYTFKVQQGNIDQVQS